MQEEIKKEGAPKRLGTVKFKYSYIVDLDDPEMVAKARENLFEDIVDASQHGKNTKTIIAIEESSQEPERPDTFLSESI